MPRPPAIAALAVTVACSVALSAQSYRFTSTWAAPDVEQIDYQGRRVAAVVISTDESLRVSGEEAMARAISARGAEGVAAYRTIPRPVLENPTEAQAWLLKTDTAGVVTMQLVDVRTRTEVGAVWTTSYYQSFSSYYGTAWQTVTPINPRQTTVVAVETLIYDVAGGRLLWAGVSESTDPRDAATFIEGLVDEIAGQLRRQGVTR